MKIIESKREKGLCVAYRCANGTFRNDRFCPRHQKLRQRENNPLAYVFNALKGNARRRKKEFSLTLEQFGAFCKETNYLELRGKKGSSASIDRRDSSKGYHIDNIQILSLAANSSKGASSDEAPF